ncbi:MAG: hypothetical protein RI935_137 [Candidatus Parcubacteria bacterium]|jgi:hypothetical protein
MQKNVSILQDPVALLYLESLQRNGAAKIEGLSKTAEVSLLISGLFPEMTKRARVSADYYLDICRTSFFDLSSYCEYSRRYVEARQYHTLALEAERITKVLRCARP